MMTEERDRRLLEEAEARLAVATMAAMIDNKKIFIVDRDEAGALLEAFGCLSIVGGL